MRHASYFYEISWEEFTFGLRNDLKWPADEKDSFFENFKNQFRLDLWKNVDLILHVAFGISIFIWPPLVFKQDSE